MVKRWKLLLTLRGSRNGEKLRKRDDSSWFSSRMISKGSQEEEGGFYGVKSSLSTKEERHARRERERVVGRRGRAEKSFSWVQTNEEEDGNSCGFSFEWDKVIVGPTDLKLQGLKTPSCGSRMRSTKERKTIVEMSSFQKI